MCLSSLRCRCVAWRGVALRCVVLYICNIFPHILFHQKSHDDATASAINIGKYKLGYTRLKHDFWELKGAAKEPQMLHFGSQRERGDLTISGPNVHSS